MRKCTSCTFCCSHKKRVTYVIHHTYNFPCRMSAQPCSSQCLRKSSTTRVEQLHEKGNVSQHITNIFATKSRIKAQKTKLKECNPLAVTCRRSHIKWHSTLTFYILLFLFKFAFELYRHFRNSLFSLPSQRRCFMPLIGNITQTE